MRLLSSSLSCCSFKSFSDLFAHNFVQTKSPSNLRLKSLFFA
nr:MAG TPA: hypothetical protein [Bacteriophage sp.]